MSVAGRAQTNMEGYEARHDYCGEAVRTQDDRLILGMNRTKKLWSLPFTYVNSIHNPEFGLC